MSSCTPATLLWTTMRNSAPPSSPLRILISPTLRLIKPPTTAAKQTLSARLPNPVAPPTTTAGPFADANQALSFLATQGYQIHLYSPPSSAISPSVIPPLRPPIPRHHSWLLHHTSALPKEPESSKASNSTSAEVIPAPDSKLCLDLSTGKVPYSTL
eukprot:gene39254-53073_t